MAKHQAQRPGRDVRGGNGKRWREQTPTAGKSGEEYRKGQKRYGASSHDRQQGHGADRGPSRGGGYGSDRGSNRGGGYGSDRGGGYGSDRGPNRGDGYASDRGGNRGSNRGGGYGSNRGGDHRSGRGGGYGSDRGPSRGPNRGGGYASDRGGDRGPSRGTGYGSDRGSSRGSGYASDRASDRGANRGGGYGSNRGSDRGPSREGGYRSDRGPNHGHNRGGGYKADRGSGRGSYRGGGYGSDQKSGRKSNRGNDRGFDRKPGRKPDRAFDRKSNRKRGGSEFIEGRRACAEALDARVPLRRALVATGVGERDRALEELIIRLEEANVPVEYVARDRLDGRSSHGAHQGIMLEVEPFEYATVDDIIEAAGEGDALVLLLDHVTDEGNFGAIVRTAEVVGAAGVVVANARAAHVGTAAYKTSAGAVLHLPIAQVSNLASAAEQLKEAGFWLGAATEHAHDDVWHAPLEGRICLVMGSEGSGISALMRKRCDFECKLPQRGRVESLNVAQATTALAYEWLRRTMEKETPEGASSSIADDGVSGELDVFDEIVEFSDSGDSDALALSDGLDGSEVLDGLDAVDNSDVATLFDGSDGLEAFGDSEAATVLDVSDALDDASVTTLSEGAESLAAFDASDVPPLIDGADGSAELALSEGAEGSAILDDFVTLDGSDTPGDSLV